MSQDHTMWSAIFLVIFMLIMLIVASAYGVTGSTWFPFQSPEVRDIYEHLTPSEKRELTLLVRELNFQQVSPMGILIGLTAVSFAFHYSVTIGLILSALYIVYILTFGRRWTEAGSRDVVCDGICEVARLPARHSEDVRFPLEQMKDP